MKDEVASVGEQTYNNSVKIQSIIDAHLSYTGRVSGKLYQWQRAGDIVEVLEEDVSELLQKRLGKRLCCGQGNDGNQIFQEWTN